MGTQSSEMQLLVRSGDESRAPISSPRECSRSADVLSARSFYLSAMKKEPAADRRPFPSEP